MSRQQPTIDSIVSTLISAFNGARLTDGGTLYATDRLEDFEQMPEARLPCIGFDGEQVQSKPWEPWKLEQSLILPARLRVSALKRTKGSERQAMRRVLDDIARICGMIRGLPLDESGKVVAYSAETARRVDRGELQELCNRGGPHFVSATVRAVPGNPVTEAQLAFTVAFQQDIDPRKTYNASVVVIGMQPHDITRYDEPVGEDWTPPAPAGVADTTAWGRVDQEVAVFRGLDRFVPPATGVPTDRIKEVDGAERGQQLRSITVVPYTASIVAPATQQLIALASYQDGSVQNVSAIASWASSDPAKASVSATGLVTGVAAGTANITATWLGVQSSACAVTVS